MTARKDEGMEWRPVLEFVDVSKSFGRTSVLREVSFAVQRGEIHALLGVNGAGKSTLIKILAGVHRMDSGAIEVCGESLPPGHDSAAARDAGISFVHQDLGLVEEISVADNIALQLGFSRRFGLVSAAATATRVREVLASVGATFSPDRLVSSLSRDEQVLCAVARALALEPRIVVLDEVSASLPKPEVDRLAASLRRMRGGGVAFIYVTHRLDELTDLVDRVTVLRNGATVVTAPMTGLSHEALVRQIVGPQQVGSPSVRQADVARTDRSTAPLLVVRDLVTDDLRVPISFEVRPGEVLGICGLVGSGTRDLASALAGARKVIRGGAFLRGGALPLGHPEKLARCGFVVVPGDRQRDGIITGLGLRENLLPTRRRFGGWTRSGFRRPRQETAGVLRVCEAFGVVPRDDADRPVSELSGGNQQKVVFARALADRPAVAVLEDPTAGVDIGSRAVLYDLMHAAARAGSAVVLLSTDFEEVAHQAHRVLVLSHGAVAHEFSQGDGMSADQLAEASYRVPTPIGQPVTLDTPNLTA